MSSQLDSGKTHSMQLRWIWRSRWLLRIASSSNIQHLCNDYWIKFKRQVISKNMCKRYYKKEKWKKLYGLLELMFSIHESVNDKSKLPKSTIYLAKWRFRSLSSANLWKDKEKYEMTLFYSKLLLETNSLLLESNMEAICCNNNIKGKQLKTLGKLNCKNKTHFRSA